MRALQGIKLANAAWDRIAAGVAAENPVALTAVSEMSLEEFTARCDQAFRPLAAATTEAMAAMTWLAEETFALLHLIGFAIHGANWLPSLARPPQAELKTTEAAALLQCTPRHVQRLAKEGRVSARRHPDGTWRYRTTSLWDYRDLEQKAES
ncbi:helix-turn-helix domain-containing protein [Streptomyces sp. ID05-04B]|uniref:helix-turn-helix domain-containing protein n=1 Tax=Streptomyces sp. ID05-04B TaxID=3028661 RepID=UPI0029C9EE93|nr:helix-turn-helix domain-containing protein [Streptomyces sp. ID05-04B]